MPEFRPITFISGTLTFPSTGSWMHYTVLPHDSLPIDNEYPTILADSSYIQTSSANLVVSSSTISQSVLNFTYRTTVLRQRYVTDALLALQIATASTGAGLALEAVNNIDNAYAVKIATSTSSFAIRHKGTRDSASINILTASLGAINTSFPANIKGMLLQNTYNENQSTGFENTIYVASVTQSAEVRVMSESLWINTYAGFSSSAAINYTLNTPITISGSIFREITGGTYEVSQAVFPPTGNVWQSKSLAGNISDSTSTTYSQVFSITGLTDNKRYLVHFYLFAQSDATTTGFRVRAINGTNYCGTIYTPATVNALVVGNSSGSNAIYQGTAGNFPAAGQSRLIYGEFLVTKASGTDPSIDIISEVLGSSVQASRGSVVFWREVPQSKPETFFPIGIFSQSLHSFNLGSKGMLEATSLAFPTKALGFGEDGTGWSFVGKSSITNTTGSAIPYFSASLDLSSKYVLIAYIGLASTATTNGVYVTLVSSSLSDIAFHQETPVTRTTIGNGFNLYGGATTAPDSDINNFFMTKVTALIQTSGSGTPSIKFNLESEATSSIVAAGPSVLFYKKYF